MNILIIEDNHILVEQISQVFLRNTLINSLDTISSYDEYLARTLDYHHYDIILLDVMIPGACTKEKNGITIAEHIRAFHKEIPIIIMSGISDLSFLERAFEKGVNDYLIKPFRPKELEIRICKWYNNYLCSLHFFHNNVLYYYELQYSLGENQFYLDGVVLSISKKSKYLLLLLFTKSEELASSQFLMTKLWNIYSQDLDREKNLRVVVLRLKKSLQKYGIDTWLVTVYGEGYMLKRHSDIVIS